MFISPKVAIEEGWITHPNCSTYQDWEDNNFVSPNAIDFPLNRLFSINQSNTFLVSENRKLLRGGEEILPTTKCEDGSPYLFWKLNPNTVYDGVSDMYVNIPSGIAAQIIIRSTFSRNGLFITSGLWDSGFKGSIGMAIHNRSGEAFIAPGTRIGQIIFIESQNALMYAGGWNHEKGTHWSEKQ